MKKVSRIAVSNSRIYHVSILWNKCWFFRTTQIAGVYGETFKIFVYIYVVQAQILQYVFSLLRWVWYSWNANNPRIVRPWLNTCWRKSNFGIPMSLSSSKNHQMLEPCRYLHKTLLERHILLFDCECERFRNFETVLCFVGIWRVSLLFCLSSHMRLYYRVLTLSNSNIIETFLLDSLATDPSP